jgi:murein DD-endopeptidase MepM/ murein hydrolase activator NlpD
MKRALLFLLGLVAFNLVAQSETAAYKDAVNKLAGYISQHQSDAIFNMLSADMQKAMPIEKTREFFNNFKPLGKITKMDFLKFQSGEALYKMQFELGVFTLSLSLDSQIKISGFLIKPYIPDHVPALSRNIAKLRLPFNNEWFVVWGGDSKDLNYHVVNPAQKYAFDFVMIDATGKSFENAGEQNEDYYCFGEILIAPCAGEVVFTADGVKDNKPKVMDTENLFGNMVIIKTANNEFLYFCHFKQNSIAVRQGQKVKQGQRLGLCGNSGRSSEAHLHFHIQNAIEVNIATGVKCHFEHISANGEKKSDYSPVKNEKVKNLTGKE